MFVDNIKITDHFKLFMRNLNFISNFLQDHEKSCQQAVDTKKAEEFHTDFFSYMKLAPTNSPGDIDLLDSSSSSSKVVRPKPSTYAKFLSIDVCSPLGQYIYSLSSSTNSDEIDISSLCLAERKSALRSVLPHSNTYSEKIISQSVYFPNLYKGGHGDEFPVSHRRNRLRNGSRQDPHLYCFNRQHTAVRKFTLKHGKTNDFIYSVKEQSFMNFILKVPLAPSKLLSRWIYEIISFSAHRIFFSIYFFFNMKQSSEEAARQSVCNLIPNNLY